MVNRNHTSQEAQPVFYFELGSHEVPEIAPALLQPVLLDTISKQFAKGLLKYNAIRNVDEKQAVAALNKLT